MNYGGLILFSIPTANCSSEIEFHPLAPMETEGCGSVCVRVRVHVRVWCGVVWCGVVCVRGGGGGVGGVKGRDLDGLV